MSRRSSRARLPAFLLLLSAPAVFGADAKPVARVGRESVSAEALVRRIAQIPDFQRAALGDTPSKLKREVLDTLLVPDLLYSQEAARLKLADRPTVQNREREVLRAAMDHELRQETLAKAQINTEDVRAYFEANRKRFETPRRVHVWRILLDDEALAKRIIADSQGVDGIQRWSQYARDSSLDKATHLRNGDLGFVHPDGNTDTPTLRVDPVLFAAVDALRDGDIAPAPVKEGLHWAAVWRRGSMKAVTRTLDQEQGSIREVLERQRVEQARDDLLVGLRSKYVSAVNAAVLDNVRFDLEGLPVRQAPSASAHPAAAGSSVPEPGERSAQAARRCVGGALIVLQNQQQMRVSLHDLFGHQDVLGRVQTRVRQAVDQLSELFVVDARSQVVALVVGLCQQQCGAVQIRTGRRGPRCKQQGNG